MKMKVLGFNFNKQSVERFTDGTENLKISTNINISEINEVKSDILKIKDEIINVKFVYTIEYEPKLAKIEFLGNLLLSVDSKLSKEIFKQWKEKQLPEDFRIFVFNIILRKSNIKAIQFEDDMNIPFHFSLPFLKKSENKD